MKKVELIFVMKPPSSDHDFVDTCTKSLASNLFTSHLQRTLIPQNSSPNPFFFILLTWFKVMFLMSKLLSRIFYPHVLPLLQLLLGFLALELYTCTHHDQIGREFRYNDGEYTIPGLVDPVPPQVVPAHLFHKDGEYEACIKLAQGLKDSSGIIVNTFPDLEPYAINYFLHDGETPPIYPVGPMLNLRGQDHPDVGQEQLGKIMNWLDKQPQSSVVFLCFASMGILTPPQVKELAFGLEQSGYRFLWSLRAPQSIKNPEEMLPEGFLERIGERGMICGWAPQVQVLAHEATGCFISHCGWNSFLESLWYGVPVIPFPLFSNQHLNALRMAKECALAVELKFEHREDGDLVMAEEVARAVERAMEGGSEVRKNVKEMSEKSKKAVMDGGSSFLSIAKFLKDILTGQQLKGAFHLPP